jgi:hypothetical protein
MDLTQDNVPYCCVTLITQNTVPLLLRAGVSQNYYYYYYSAISVFDINSGYKSISYF